ncbi:MAG: glycosyltransferase family 2 protein [Rikenellaceae bacterium]
MGITVIIHTYNAETQLQRAIDSVLDFDEVLVCDMESTDSTRDIAMASGCRVEVFPRGEHTVAEAARDYAIKLAREEWVLEVDADEIVTPQLREYLYELIKRDDCPDGLWIPRQNYFMGRALRSLYPDHILRFFRRDLAYWPPLIHSMPTINGRVERIPSSRKELAFLHLDDCTIADYISKANIYTNNEVQRRRDKNYGAAALVLRPMIRFLKALFFKGGIFEGKRGFIRATFDAYYQFIYVVKIFEERELKGSSSNKREEK